MGTVSHRSPVRTDMKLLVAISALLALCLADDAKVVTAPLPYAGYPYAGYPYNAGYGYAGYPYAAPVAAAPVAPVTYAAPVAAPVAPVTYAAPVAPVTYAAPVAAAPYAPFAAPIAPYNVGSQFHAQDEFGNLNYGYANINSAKEEVGNTYGGVSGGYSYVDSNGVLQQVKYIADGAGFRVADSRLPVAPVYDGVAPTFNPELPVAPADTPEVAEAKAEFAAAYAAQEAAVAEAEPAERKRREADPAFAYGFGTVHPYGYAGYPYHGLNHGAYGYAAGLPYYG